MKMWTRSELNDSSNYIWESIALTSEWNVRSKWQFIQMMRDDFNLVWC